LSAIACWARIIIASTKPRISMIIASVTYMMPMRLWSTLVSHSSQRYRHSPNQVMPATTASAPPTVTSAPPKAIAL
jgi:hypothetical protein